MSARQSLAAAFVLCLQGIGALALAVPGGQSEVRPNAPAAQPAGADLLLLRDGSRLSGTLTGCGREACRLDGATIERSRIAWIGLHGVTEPPVRDPGPSADTVFLSSGETKLAALSGVDALEVATEGGSYPRSAVSWVLIGSGSPSQPVSSPSPGPADKCPKTDEADNLLRTNRAQYATFRDEIAKRWEEHENQMGNARENAYDFQVTVRVCNNQEWIGKVLIALVAPDVEAEEALSQANDEGGAEVSSAQEQEALLRGGIPTVAAFVAKLANGEKPWATLAPAQVQGFEKTCTAAGKILGLWQGPSGEEMSRELDVCAGTSGVEPETYANGQAFLAALKAAVEQLPQIQTLVAKLKQLDEQLPQLQDQAYRACADRARCLGQPESACDERRVRDSQPQSR